jgi:hypothetical protein
LSVTKTQHAAVIQRQSERLERRINILSKIADRLSLVRLLVFLAGAVVSLAALYLSVIGFFIALILSLIGFGLSVAVHRRTQSTIQRHQLLLRLYRGNLARMKHEWEAIPIPKLPPFPIAEHPFALDLDIAGARSLHHLLDTAASFEGSLRLREWLLNTVPDLKTIQCRQALVGELRAHWLFRNRLAVDSALAFAFSLPDEAVLQWLQQKSVPLAGWALPLLFLLAAGNIGLALIAGAVGVPPALQAGVFVAYVAVYFMQTGAIGDIFGEALTMSSALRGLETVFRRIERTPQQGAIGQLCAPFHDAKRPSRELRRLNRVLAAASVRGNPMLWLALNALLPWDLLVARNLHRLKAELATEFPIWLNCWHDLEALSSLANFAALNPEATFPTIHEADTKPVFKAEELGHPLIPDAVKVRNDFTLDHSGKLILITGSNMAGKSSFLRTVGINAVLAFAGGVVDAPMLELRLCRVFSSMRVTDSVNDGISYFYAEVRRLRALLSALEQPAALPLLYLIDEIFRGTNNRERLIGSRSYLRALVDKNGFGIVSTHDLELVRLADELPAIANYHFREEIREGQMTFDYQLRPGPCPTTNALQVMRLAGLPIEG